MAPEAGEDTAMAKARLQTALRSFQSSGRPFQLIQPHAPAPVPASTASTATTSRKCRTLVVLDSSFNPPTLAHLHMATSAVQDLRAQQNIAARARPVRGGSGGQETHDLATDVRLLLLLAVNNADKAPKPATFEERLLMMEAFARDIQKAHDSSNEAKLQLPVDIGLTTHPYFHDKSAAIAASAEYAGDDGPSSQTSTEGEGKPQTKQIFLAGYDTLIRIFTPKYYTHPPQPDKTPMQMALDPFFARAQLRITMRTDDDWGGMEDQLGYIERIMHGKELEEVGGRKEWARRVELVEGTSRLGGTEGAHAGVVSSTLAREAVKSKDWGRLRGLVPGEVARLIEEDAVAW
ncbi:cytidylyltransferase [Diaporthe helianthi]|uniref:Cytidylyltransferase n=1 Tax=Diaporthe helianthi TaxID=158607 RepID=A0A2P5HY69_DIAHE|nr:cytidylyltransferase [Diaporthe helianthi]